jgi:hypothetical protein
MKINLTILAFLLMVLIACHSGAGSESSDSDIDHVKVINSLNNVTLKKGQGIYIASCMACHGKDGTASLPQARSFNKDRFRFGNKPYDMWKTITNGAGMMAAQSWLSPVERYYVIQYIREEFIKKSNLKQYFKITDEYLAKLPKSQRSADEQAAETKKLALLGSIKYGQEWFQFSNSDYGNFIYSPLLNHSSAALTINLENDVNISYNLLRMGTDALWTGKLNLSDTKYKRYIGGGEPFIQGTEFSGLNTWQWTYKNSIEELERKTGLRKPLSSKYLNYLGNYKNGKYVILSYSIMGRKILELPQAIKYHNKIIISQTLQIEAGTKEQSIYIGQLIDTAATFKDGIVDLDGKFNKNGFPEKSVLVSSTIANNSIRKFIAAGIISDQIGFKFAFDSKHRLILVIPASKIPITLQVLRTVGEDQGGLIDFLTYIKSENTKKTTILPANMITGGLALWPQKIKVEGQLNADNPHFDPVYFQDKDKTDTKKLLPIPGDYPYTVDNITLPYNNPYNAWLRPTCLGFKSDGSLILGTYTGDIWLCTGIDNTLKNITWQRIAAGLDEPFGIKVVKDEVYVTCHNGIVKLHDFNGDGETDFYENFFSDQDVSHSYHSFNFGLETDSKGNFYYTKVGQYTDNKDPGNVIKVSPDGKKWESIATGMRVPNGIAITPDDKIYTSDNQGNWQPANKINLIDKGEFYGYVPNLVEKDWSPNGIKFPKESLMDNVISSELVKVPKTFHQPALWIPQEFDNSPGGGVWSDKSWGPLGDHFIHSSYGHGWLYYFLPHKVEGVTQGALVALPFQMDAGVQRVSVNPVDRNIYTTGLNGWGDGVYTKYGILSRIRYRGGEGHLITDAEVVKTGIKLSFNCTLDSAVSCKISNYDVTEWNYLWTNKYGSADYSVKNPRQKGIDKVIIQNISLSADNKALILHISDIGPAQTMRLRFQVQSRDGVTIKNSVYLTINKVPAK